MRPLAAGAPGWGRKPRPGHTAASAPALGAPSSGLGPHGPGARRRGGFRLAAGPARLHGSRPVPRSRAFGAGRGLSAPPHGSPGLAVVCGAPAPRRGGSPGGLGEDSRRPARVRLAWRPPGPTPKRESQREWWWAQIRKIRDPNLDADLGPWSVALSPAPASEGSECLPWSDQKPRTARRAVGNSLSG